MRMMLLESKPAQTRWRAVLLLVMVALLVTACDQGPAPLTKAEPGPIHASGQRSGDAERGRDALLNRAAVTCGLPYSAYAASTGAPPPEFALHGRRGRNAELPYMFTAHRTVAGVELVTSNCLGCHATPLNGELIIGLGNEFLDFSDDKVMTVESAGAYVEGDAEAAEWRRWADRISAIAPFMTTDTIGANPANMVTLALMAHRDPDTLAWSDAPLLRLPPTPPLPVSVPPWWNMAKKHASFYNGEGRGDQVGYMMLASTTCTDSVAEAREIDAWMSDVRAYIATLEPPAYPYAVDQALAKSGERVFNRECKECHGSYGAVERYPNELVALDEVGTDPRLAEGAFNHAERFFGWFQASFYGRNAEAQPALGYVAPPLDGVWATAPYLHNGSVPTLAALLDSSQRPVAWRYGSSPPDYDQTHVGWQVESVADGKDAFASIDEQKWVYDTGLKGYGNQGHDFGDALDEGERKALIEYLKTL